MSDARTEQAPALPRPQAKGNPARPAAQWLVLAYLAADNDLEGELLADLAEMERVGSSPGVVDVLAQVDRSPGHDASQGNWHGTRRYYVTRSTDPRRITSRLLADLGPTNTGDPGVLESFIRFGAQRYPSRATAVILLNHGSGFYVPPEMRPEGSERRDDAERSNARSHRRRPMFSTTRERLQQAAAGARGIAYDDGAGDCLDNQELKRVLATAHRLLGRKVDVVGMDACLMTMLEVAYQIRDHARVLVGSEELEPGPGWPHAAILGDLVKSPTITGAELGATIVPRYVEAYRHGAEEATQSAIDLEQLDELVEAVDVLGRRLIAGIKSPAVATALRVARARTLDFFDGLYVDLHHLADNLAKTSGPGRIADTCFEIQQVIDGVGVRSPIIAEGHVGARLAPARGLSLYFPTDRPASDHYQELDFARRTKWGELLVSFWAR